MTDEQLNCEHQWGLHCGSCLECGVTKDMWIDHGCPLPRSDEDMKLIRLTERELGMPETFDDYTREYLIPTPKSKAKFETNGTR